MARATRSSSSSSQDISTKTFMTNIPISRSAESSLSAFSTVNDHRVHHCSRPAICAMRRRDTMPSTTDETVEMDAARPATTAAAKVATARRS
jgi:hypothetical protein